MQQILLENTIPNEQIEVVTPAPRETWWQLFHDDRHALTTQSPAWTDAICHHGGYRDTSRLYRFAGGRQAVLPLVRRKMPSVLAAAGSMPVHWGYGGLISPDPVGADDVRLVWQDLAAQGWQHVHVRPNPLLAQVWENGRISPVQSRPKCAHVLHLDGGFDTVWRERFSGTTRRNVRKAEKSGLTIECDATGRLVPVFYELFQRSVKRWARQQHEPAWLALWRSQRRDPPAKFQEMLTALGEMGKLWVAWHEGEAVAAILVLQGHNAHYTRGVMNREIANQTRANDLLHSLAIEAACQDGCRAYHMGETGESASLAQFKEKFGARPYTYAEYYLERLPVTAVDQKLRQLVKTMIGFKDT